MRQDPTHLRRMELEELSQIGKLTVCRHTVESISKFVRLIARSYLRIHSTNKGGTEPKSHHRPGDKREQV